MLHAEEGLSISPRRITLSTVGIVPGLERLAREPLMPNLAISLHATTEEQRTALVPPNAKYSLAAILDACRRFPAEETQPHHLRVRAAQRGQRHTRGRTQTREAALRDQGQGQPDTTQCRTRNSVRAALGCTRRSIRADPRRPASHRLGEKEPWSRYPGRMRSADCGRRIEEIGRPADGASAALTPTTSVDRDLEPTRFASGDDPASPSDSCPSRRTIRRRRSARDGPCRVAMRGSDSPSRDRCRVRGARARGRRHRPLSHRATRHRYPAGPSMGRRAGESAADRAGVLRSPRTAWATLPESRR